MAKQKHQTLNRKLQEEGFNLIAHASNTNRELPKEMKRFEEEIRKGFYESYRIVDGNSAIAGSGYVFPHPKTFFYAKFSKISQMHGRGVSDIGFATVKEEKTSRREKLRVTTL